MPHVSIDQSFDMYFEVSGEGRPIVFIHPPAMGLVTFKKQQPLSKKYKLITYDIRGNGRSGFSDEKITIRLLANDLQKLLDNLNIDKAVICGYSNGCSIVLEFALTYPERTVGIILSGGFPEVNSYILEQQFRLGMLTARWNGIKLLGKVLARSHTSEKSFQKEIYDYIQKVNPNILFQMYKQGLEYNCTVQLSQIEKPLLLTYGGKIHYLHKHYKLFESNVRDPEIIFIGNARHQIPTKHFLEFNKIIGQFMEKTKSSNI